METVYIGISLFFISFIYNKTNSQSVFEKANVCVQENIGTNCFEKIAAFRNLLECVGECQSQPNCVMASFKNDRECFLHRQCSPALGFHNNPCDLFENDIVQHTAYKLIKRCVKSGIGQTEIDYCQCFGGNVGKNCERYPTSCLELLEYGYQSASYWLTLDPDRNVQNPIHQFNCFVSPGYSHVLVISFKEPPVSKNLTWIQYRDGFKINKAFFAGLQAMYYLSRVGYNALFVIIKIPGLGLLYRKYSNFIVSDENDSFSFAFGKTTEIIDDRGDELRNMGHSFGDCFGPLSNIPFSTWDKDSDGQRDNCAAQSSNGWWFKNCNPVCNLFGYGPAYWGPDIYESQRMKIPGIDFTKMIGREITIEAYVRKL